MTFFCIPQKIQNFLILRLTKLLPLSIDLLGVGGLLPNEVLFFTRWLSSSKTSSEKCKFLADDGEAKLSAFITEILRF